MGRAERIGTREASLIIGLPGRTIMQMAKDGDLDPAGAARIRQRWTFDEIKLRAWVRTKEDEQCRKNGRRLPAATGAKVRSGLVLPSKVSKSDEAYQQAMSGLLRPAMRS